MEKRLLKAVIQSDLLNKNLRPETCGCGYRKPHHGPLACGCGYRKPHHGPLACGLRPAANKGVTLIELIMVITIAGILTTAGSMYIRETIGLWRFVTFRSEVTAQVRTTLIRMAREIRQLKDDLSVYTAAATQFRFDDTNANNIDYRLSGGNLLRNSDILASGVSGLSFTYYDIENNALTAPFVSPINTNIHRINIALSIQSGGQTKTSSLEVYPRNLRLF